MLGLLANLPTGCALLHSLLQAKQTVRLTLQMPVSWQPITSLYCVRTYYEPSDYRDLTARADSALVTALQNMPDPCVALHNTCLYTVGTAGCLLAGVILNAFVRVRDTRPAAFRCECRLTEAFREAHVCHASADVLNSAAALGAEAHLGA